MKFLFYGLFACVASPLWALEVQVPLQVRAAEIYPDGATVTLEMSAETGVGLHTISTLVPRSLLGDLSGFDFRVEGGALRRVSYGENHDYLPSTFETALQAEAREALRLAESDVETARAKAEALDTEISTVDARVDFVLSVGGGDALPSPDVLRALSTTIAEELSSLGQERADLTARRKAAGEEISKREAALLQAAGRYARLTAPQEDWALISVDVLVEDGGRVSLTADVFEERAGWSISYGVDLLEEAAKVNVTRRLLLRQSGPISWAGTKITLSTAAPTGEIAASEVGRSIARLGPEFDARSLARAADVTAEPMFEAGVAETFVVPDLTGPVVRYRLDETQTLYRDSLAEVLLAPAMLDADVYLAASPRVDDTAFYMALIENTLSEPFLPGEAMFSRDGSLIGLGVMPAVPAGGAAALGFGPEMDVVLEFQAVDVQSGDRGLIRSSNTREDDIVLTATNLGTEDRNLRLRYAVPTSQQEDLSIDVDMVPAPTERDVENRLGVHEWRLALSAGAEASISLRYRMQWPEGQELFWQP